ncbi:hypothetical protein HMPREF9466_02750 [Fusobacterium necrophorum subsp. funduliforme 1_1_36S]|nr:hypothetical protein HMPREF9466_02750 [Fusobacterium necrophorum subsp. funduliforme 1_1_36S]
MSNKNYLLSCEIKHRIRGRIRIKSRALKYLGELREEVEKQLMQVRYIERVHISQITGSIVIYFEDITLTDQNLLSLLQNTLNAYLVEIYKNEKIANGSKYVIERKLQEESPKEIIQKIVASSMLLVYNIFRPSGPTAVGISRFFQS